MSPSGSTEPNAPAASASAAPQADSSTPSASKASAAFPFPEDAKGNVGSDSGTEASSSSSSAAEDGDAASAGSPDVADPADKGSEASSGRHLLHRVNPVGTKLQTAEERETEDLNVARFYIDSGNLAGAYLRGQDAVKTAPDDPDAHFTLAEVALKLNKREEAIAEFNACLKLDPPAKEAKKARKTLEEIKP